MNVVSISQPAETQPAVNLEGEAAFLGAVLNANPVVRNLDVPLRPEHFSEPLHQRIYERALALIDRHQVANPVTLKPYFDGDPALKELGGINYLARLTADGQGLLAVSTLAQQIYDLAKLREVAAIGARLSRSALESTEDFDPIALVEEAERTLADLRADHPTRGSALLAYEWAGDVQPVLDGFWLIPDVVPRSGPTTIFGHPGGAKTFLALSIAAAVASGRTWAGRPVEKGPVLYVVAEGVTGFRNRLVAMINAGQLKRTDPFAYIPTVIDLQAPDGDVDKLIATLRHFSNKVGQSPALIVVDTLSKTFGAGSENTDDMVSYVANCERISSAFDCATIIVHHRPRDGAHERGHSSLRGGVVAAISIEGDEIRTATTVKQKDGPEGEKIHFRLAPVVLGQNKDGKDVTTCLVEFVDPDDADLVSGQAKPELKGQKQVAYRVIENLLALHGESVPDIIPADCIDRWKVRKVIRAGQVSDKLKSEFLSGKNGDPDKNPDTARRTASRILTDLKAAEILGSWEDYLWLN